MANGSRHSMYAVKEQVYGITPTDPALWTVRLTGTTLALAKESLQSEEIRGDRQIADFRMSNNQVGGDINCELSYGSFDDLLQGVLLSSGWEADTPKVGTDQIKAGIERSSFSMVRHFGDMEQKTKPYYIYRGVEVNSLQLTVAPGAMVTAVFSVVGQSQTTAETLSDLGAANFEPVSTTAPLDSFTGALKESGNVIGVVTEITLTLQNGIEPRFVVGSKDTIYPSVGRSNLTGQITAYFEDSTLVDKFINEDDSSLEFSLPDGEGNTMTFIIPRIKYTGGQPDVSGEGSITLSMPFQALLDPDTKTNIIIQRTKA